MRGARLFDASMAGETLVETFLWLEERGSLHLTKELLTRQLRKGESLDQN